MSGGHGQRRRTGTSEAGDPAIMGLGGRGLGGGIAEQVERLARDRIGQAASVVVSQAAKTAATGEVVELGEVTVTDDGVLTFDGIPEGLWFLSCNGAVSYTGTPGSGAPEDAVGIYALVYGWDNPMFGDFSLFAGRQSFLYTGAPHYVPASGEVKFVTAFYAPYTGTIAWSATFTLHGVRL